MGDSEFDPKAGAPGYLYLKLADHLAGLIDSEELKSGSRLPGERAFAEEHNVSIGTARRAMDELRLRGLIITLPAKGTFINPPDQRMPPTAFGRSGPHAGNASAQSVQESEGDDEDC